MQWDVMGCNGMERSFSGIYSSLSMMRSRAPSSTSASAYISLYAGCMFRVHVHVYLLHSSICLLLPCRILLRSGVSGSRHGHGATTHQRSPPRRCRRTYLYTPAVCFAFPFTFAFLYLSLASCRFLSRSRVSGSRHGHARSNVDARPWMYRYTLRSIGAREGAVVVEGDMS